jgi:bifunctional DNase/RNase
MPKILPLLSALLALVACSEPGGSEGDTAADAVAVSVRGVGLDPSNRMPVLLLEERGGDRVLPIWIGSFEARSIQAQIDSQKPERPNTHDLAQQLLVHLDATIVRVTVTELRGNTYYAVVRVLADQQEREIDARPSDAIAMALRFDAPVYVNSALFDAQAGTTDRVSGNPAAEIRL